MERKNLIFCGLLTLVVGLMLGGCSQLSQNQDGSQGDLSLNNSSPSMEVTPPPFQYNPYEYPQAANVPPPGYQFIDISKGVVPEYRSIDGDNDFDVWNLPDTAWAGKFVQYHQDKKIKINKNQIKIKNDCMPYPAWVTMSKPDSLNPWIDFEPHGIVFDRQQEVKVKFYYNSAWLPPGVYPEDLEIWYWNEELEVYEYIGGDNHPNDQKIEFFLDHFSRYVVASRLTSY